MSKNPYDKLLETAYKKYKKDWCNSRGWPLKEVEAAYERDEEYKGQMFVCLDEFEDCEFQDEDYMLYLLSEDEFAFWQELLA